MAVASPTSEDPSNDEGSRGVWLRAKIINNQHSVKIRTIPTFSPCEPNVIPVTKFRRSETLLVFREVLAFCPLFGTRTGVSRNSDKGWHLFSRLTLLGGHAGFQRRREQVGAHPPVATAFNTGRENGPGTACHEVSFGPANLLVLALPERPSPKVLLHTSNVSKSEMCVIPSSVINALNVSY